MRRAGSPRIDYSATYMPSGPLDINKNKCETDAFGYSHNNWCETVWNMRHILGLIYSFRSLLKDGYLEGSHDRKVTRKQTVAVVRVAYELDHAFFNEETRRPPYKGNHLLDCKVATTRMMIMSVKAHRKIVRMVRLFTGNMILPPI